MKHEDKTIIVAGFAAVCFWCSLQAMAQAPGTPGSPQTCAGAVTILLNGQALANAVSGCVLNIKAGTGIIATPAADRAIGGTDISFSVNSALIPTMPQIEQDVIFCDSHQGTAQYACQLPYAITTIQRGMEVLLAIDTACSTNCSLLLSQLPAAISIKQADGSTDPMGTGFLGTAGQAGRIWFDGTVFRLE
jgi:hypothetical protein